jgi:antitoxin HicB
MISHPESDYIYLETRGDLTLFGEYAMKWRAIIEQDEDGIFVAEVPALPGCISQGTTREEARQNVNEAIQAYLESLKENGDPIPPPINEEVIEVDV